jgi:hypothetical protein
VPLASKQRGKAKQGRLKVRRTVDVPLAEVSGVCLRRDRGRMSLVAIGDSVSIAATVVLPRSDEGPLEWRTEDLGRFPGSRLPKRDPQIEAVCADGAGRILLLQEAPPRVELVDLRARRVVASLALEVPGDGKIARSWADPEGSRGEGAVFLRAGHLLVAKEKGPKALIEFGPPRAASLGLARGGALGDGARWPVAPGDHRYEALAVWKPDEALAEACEDFSDLEVGPDGRLYVLSDKSNAIARIADLPRGGGTAALAAAWRLRGIDGKPEGLAFTPRGRAIVALDTRRARHNLVLLEPPIAGR